MGESKKNGSAVATTKRRDMRVDLTSAIKVDMNEIGGIQSMPGSTSVTPGRTASAGKSRPSYSSRASAKDRGL